VREPLSERRGAGDVSGYIMGAEGDWRPGSLLAHFPPGFVLTVEAFRLIMAGYFMPNIQN